MDDEFKEEEFYMKLLRMGSQHPEVRDQIREVLDRIDQAKEEGEEDESD